MIENALQVVLALAFVASGVPKLSGRASSLRMRDELAQSATTWRAAGAFELFGGIALGVGLWQRQLGFVGAMLLSGVMLVALGIHFRRSDPPAKLAPAATFLGLLAALLALRGLELLAMFNPGW